MAEERSEVEATWGPVRTDVEGRGWRGILEACAAREIDVLLLVGVDPLRDYPDAKLARHALENAGRKLVVGLELGELEPYADAFLPAAAWVERPGAVREPSSKRCWTTEPVVSEINLHRQIRGVTTRCGRTIQFTVWESPPVGQLRRGRNVCRLEPRSHKTDLCWVERTHKDLRAPRIYVATKRLYCRPCAPAAIP